MSAQPEHIVQNADSEIDFDTPSKKGWDFFTKFLLGNVVATVVVLVFIAALTVWQ